MIRASAVALVVALLGLMRGVAALGVGNIEVESGLNEPLLAQIELRAVQSGDIEQMTVSLGTAEQFARAGIERPFHLATLRFEYRPFIYFQF